ncbi:hypothetical protein FDUTEX481_00645 [Tolypothrix sp. PCC 7601]|nr:hypothetical protein FDUTEX481_00645 [Tolypothrix sp. PCC 7601]
MFSNTPVTVSIPLRGRCKRNPAPYALQMGLGRRFPSPCGVGVSVTCRL